MIDPNDQNRTIDFFRQQFVEHQTPTSRCFYCHAPTTQNGVGRMQVYCSNACKQAQYRLSKNGFERKRISRRQKKIQTAISLEQCKDVSLTLRNSGSSTLTLRNAGGFNHA